MALSFARTKTHRAEKGDQCNALGHSRGGFSTKILAIFDTKGRPLHVAITLGQRHEMTAARELLQARGKALIGDTGYDSNEFVQAVRDKGMKPVIHSKPERKKKHRLARAFYRRRYVVEVFFHNLKRFSSGRDSVREDRTELPGARSTCMYFDLAGELGQPSSPSASPPFARTTCSLSRREKAAGKDEAAFSSPSCAGARGKFARWLAPAR